LKYIVGYPISGNDGFIENIIKNKEHISEVYFSWGDLPNGRSALSINEVSTLFEVQERQKADLKRLSNAGIRFNLLFNANCYGKDSQSRSFFNKIGNLTDFIQNEFGLNSVTTSSPLIAKFINENFEGIDVRASVNMEIGSVEGLSYVSQFFDSFYIKREMNRNLPMLRRVRKWCDDNGKQMYLLANSGCLNHCSSHTFHDNLVAHEAEIFTMDNGYEFRGLCWEYLSQEKSLNTWLQRTNFIRPEDVSLYEGLTPAMKLATRVNGNPTLVLNAYLERSYSGGTTDLLEPNHGAAMYPRYIDNQKIEKDFAENVLRCSKNCEACGYCEEVTRKACVTLLEDPSMRL